MSAASPEAGKKADGMLTPKVCADVIDLFAEFDWFLENWPKVPVMKRVGLKARLLKVIMKHVKAAAKSKSPSGSRSPSALPKEEALEEEPRRQEESAAADGVDEQPAEQANQDAQREQEDQARQEKEKLPTKVLAEPQWETSTKSGTIALDELMGVAHSTEGGAGSDEELLALRRESSMDEPRRRTRTYPRPSSLVQDRSSLVQDRGFLSRARAQVNESQAAVSEDSLSDSSHTWSFCEPMGFSMPEYSEEESTEDAFSQCSSQCSSPRDEPFPETVQWTKASGSAAVAIALAGSPVPRRQTFTGYDVLRSASHQLLQGLHRWTNKECAFPDFQKAATKYTDAVPLAMQLRVTWDLSKWMMGSVVSMKKFFSSQKCNEKLVLEATSMRPSVITIVINDILKEVKFNFDQISHILRDILSTMSTYVPESLWSRDSAIIMNLFNTIVRVVRRLIYLVTTIHRLEEVRDSMPPDEGVLLLQAGFNMESGMRPTCNGAMSIDNIVYNLTAATNASDSHTVATFVVTYSTYISPTEFFSRLVDCFHQVWERENKDTASMVRMRVGQVLKSWIKRRFGDFDQELLQGLYSFIEDHVRPYSAAMAKILADATEEEVTKRQARQQMVKLLAPEPYTDDELANGHHCSLLETASITDVAQQMTAIDAQLFAAIENQALLHTAWEKAQLAHRAQSVTQLMDRLNRITWWVGLEILSRETPEERAEVMKWFLSLAEELKGMRNYQSMTGVVAGLSQLTVHRLKATKKALGKRASKSLAALRSLMDPSDQHGNYRAEQRKALGERSVPYIGVWLSDLARIDEGNDDYVGTLVNFDKCALIYSVVSEIELAKDLLHSFPMQEPLHAQLTYLPELDEDVLYELSTLREPPVKRK